MPNCKDCNIKLKDKRSIRCRVCANLGKRNPAYGKKRSLEARQITSMKNKGNSKCAWNKGGKWSIEHRMRLSRAHKKRVLEGKHNFYIDGRSATYIGNNARKIVHNSLEYKLWREAVFARDNWTCTECKDKGEKGHPVYLEADHIKPWALYPALRFAIDNGRTLCNPCHRKTDTWGIKALLYKEVAQNS